MGEDAERVLSSGGLQLVELADQADEISAAAETSVEPVAAVAAAQGVLPPRAGSDPFAAEDFVSRFTGMTQNETTAARCGDSVVLGFNDTGSLAATIALRVSPSGSLSFNGWSTSTDGGVSFTDLGALLPDPLPEGVQFRDLLGDPVVGCTSESTFYYSSIATEFATESQSSGISVSRSTDGGLSWGGAVMAVSKNAFVHFLGKEWMAVEPGPTESADDDVIHVTYTDFDFSSSSATCGDDQRTAIEYVRSTDGGATWTAPIVIEEVCGFFEVVQASQVEAGLGDDVYVAWERYERFFFFSEERDIRISKSTDGGASFGAPQIVTPITPIGNGSVVQGNVRAFLDLQGLAVDRSSGPRGGAVYITWHDGGKEITPDPFGDAFPGCTDVPTYCFGDILFTSSTDGGVTWASPARVNDDAASLGIDQFMPAMDVDRSGNVWVFFYDRRRDSRNFLIDAFVARSRDGGTTWRNTKATGRNFVPVVGQDLLGISRGVIVAWGDNSLGDANVLQRRFGTGGGDD